MFRNSVLFLIHALCGLVILLAGAWAFLGMNIGELTPLYVGEVASVWAFGLSWLVAGFYLTAPARIAACGDSEPIPATDTAISH